MTSDDFYQESTKIIPLNMHNTDLRTFTEMGSRLLDDFRGKFRQELLDSFERILQKLDNNPELNQKQKEVLGAFSVCGKTILSKSARDFSSR